MFASQPYQSAFDPKLESSHIDSLYLSGYNDAQKISTTGQLPREALNIKDDDQVSSPFPRRTETLPAIPQKQITLKSEKNAIQAVGVIHTGGDDYPDRPLQPQAEHNLRLQKSLESLKKTLKVGPALLMDKRPDSRFIPLDTPVFQTEKKPLNLEYTEGETSEELRFRSKSVIEEANRPFLAKKASKRQLVIKDIRSNLVARKGSFITRNAVKLPSIKSATQFTSRKESAPLNDTRQTDQAREIIRKIVDSYSNTSFGPSMLGKATEKQSASQKVLRPLRRQSKIVSTFSRAQLNRSNIRPTTLLSSQTRSMKDIWSQTQQGNLEQGKDPSELIKISEIYQTKTTESRTSALEKKNMSRVKSNFSILKPVRPMMSKQLKQDRSQKTLEHVRSFIHLTNKMSIGVMAGRRQTENTPKAAYEYTNQVTLDTPPSAFTPDPSIYKGNLRGGGSIGKFASSKRQDSVPPSLPELYPEMFSHEIPSSQLTPSRKTPIASTPKQQLVTDQQRMNMINQINYINSLDQYYQFQSQPVLHSIPSDVEEPYNFIKKGVIRHKNASLLRDLSASDFQRHQVIPIENDANNYLNLKEALLRQTSSDSSNSKKSRQDPIRFEAPPKANGGIKDTLTRFDKDASHQTIFLPKHGEPSAMHTLQFIENGENTSTHSINADATLTGRSNKALHSQRSTVQGPSQDTSQAGGDKPRCLLDQIGMITPRENKTIDIVQHESPGQLQEQHSFSPPIESREEALPSTDIKAFVVKSDHAGEVASTGSVDEKKRTALDSKIEHALKQRRKREKLEKFSPYLLRTFDSSSQGRSTAAGAQTGQPTAGKSKKEQALLLPTMKKRASQEDSNGDTSKHSDLLIKSIELKTKKKPEQPVVTAVRIRTKHDSLARRDSFAEVQLQTPTKLETEFDNPTERQTQRRTQRKRGVNEDLKNIVTPVPLIHKKEHLKISSRPRASLKKTQVGPVLKKKQSQATMDIIRAVSIAEAGGSPNRISPPEKSPPMRSTIRSPSKDLSSSKLASQRTNAHLPPMLSGECLKINLLAHKFSSTRNQQHDHKKSSGGNYRAMISDMYKEQTKDMTFYKNQLNSKEHLSPDRLPIPEFGLSSKYKNNSQLSNRYTQSRKQSNSTLYLKSKQGAPAQRMSLQQSALAKSSQGLPSNFLINSRPSYEASPMNPIRQLDKQSEPDPSTKEKSQTETFQVCETEIKNDTPEEVPEASMSNEDYTGRKYQVVLVSSEQIFDHPNLPSVLLNHVSSEINTGADRSARQPSYREPPTMNPTLSSPLPMKLQDEGTQTRPDQDSSSKINSKEEQEYPHHSLLSRPGSEERRKQTLEPSPTHDSSLAIDNKRLTIELAQSQEKILIKPKVFGGEICFSNSNIQEKFSQNPSSTASLRASKSLKGLVRGGVMKRRDVRIKIDRRKMGALKEHTEIVHVPSVAEK